MQKEKFFSEMKDKPVGDVFKRALSAHRMVGVDKLEKPRPDWPEEKWAKFYDDIGRPKDAASYRRPENLPDGSNLTEDGFFKQFYEVMHKEGISERQAANIARAFADFRLKSDEHLANVIRQERDQHLAALQKEWGLAYSDQLKLANDAAQRFGGDELVKLLTESPLGNQPALIKALANVGKAVSEDAIIGRGSPAPSFTPAGAQAEIAKLQADAEFTKALFNDAHPGHKEALARWQQLHDYAYPAKKAG